MLSGPPTGHFLARRGLVKKQYRRLGRTAGGSRQYTHATSPDGLDSPIRPPTDAFQTVGIFFRHAANTTNRFPQHRLGPAVSV